MKKLSADYIAENSDDDKIDRRGFLKCMAWAGTGIVWSINGGVLTSTVLGESATDGSKIATAELNFVQISDSHIGFNKPANTDVVGTCRETIARINALPKTPEFLLHTGDLTHLSDPAQFDTLAQLLKDCKTTNVFYVPGEHDIYDNGALFKERFGKNTLGTGWYSFDQRGVHFIGLVNVANIQEGGLGTLGQEQLDWLENDVKGLSASTPIVLFAHIPLWAVYPQWGWGTDDAERALSFLKRFGSVTVLKRAHSPGDAEGRRQYHVPHRPRNGVPSANTRFGAETFTGCGRSRSAQEDARTDQRHLHRNEPQSGRR